MVAPLASEVLALVLVWVLHRGPQASEPVLPRSGLRRASALEPQVLEVELRRPLDLRLLLVLDPARLVSGQNQPQVLAPPLGSAPLVHLGKQVLRADSGPQLLPSDLLGRAPLAAQVSDSATLELQPLAAPLGLEAALGHRHRRRLPLEAHSGRRHSLSSQALASALKAVLIRAL